MSFLYALLTRDCVSACESVGLDPQFGYLHVLRPGRPSLALDLMEEFRAPVADKITLTLINRKQLQANHFIVREDAGDSVLLNEDGRKILLTEYQQFKQHAVKHTLLKEDIPFGLIPDLQARLLSRYLRGDVPHYTPWQYTG
jgi:CRISPR-associated protein Cas1